MEGGRWKVEKRKVKKSEKNEKVKKSEKSEQ